MEGLFSKRFGKAMHEKTIEYPSFKRQLRKRLAMICREFNEESYGSDPDTEDGALIALKKAYGTDKLRVQDEETDGDREPNGFDDFMVFAYPHSVIDALEAFHRLLPSAHYEFQSRLNAVFEEEGATWRMSDGHMYQIDSRYLDELKRQAEEEMKREGFLGAHEEFKDARSHLQAGDADDAIHNANRAFESALKSLLNQREGTADDLLKKLRNETDLLAAIPPEAQKAMVSTVLQGLPTLRHKIAGHGQGAEPIDVPRAFGELAINMAATYIRFLLDLKKELDPPKEEAKVDREDDLPF